MYFWQHGYNEWNTISESTGKTYLITAHLGPDLWPPKVYVICSCEGFTLNVARNAGDVFENACKHVTAFIDQEELNRLEKMPPGRVVQTCSMCGTPAGKEGDTAQAVVYFFEERAPHVGTGILIAGIMAVFYVAVTILNNLLTCWTEHAVFSLIC